MIEKDGQTYSVAPIAELLFEAFTDQHLDWHDVTRDGLSTLVAHSHLGPEIDAWGWELEFHEQVELLEAVIHLVDRRI